MKKIVLALQIVGITAMFPLYIISELNHVPVKLPPADRSQRVTEVQSKAISNVLPKTVMYFKNQYMSVKKS